MNQLNRFIGIMAGFALTFAIVSTVSAMAINTAPGQNKIQCFDGITDGGYNGICTLNSKGAKGSATLNNIDTDTDPYNNYSGVYTANSRMYGQTLDEIGMLSFRYTGDAATAGSPRFSIPIDEDGDGTTENWAFISAYYCDDSFGLVDAIHDTSCSIYVGAETFANWDEWVIAHPDWMIATDNYVFVIADDPGLWTVNHVTFGKPGK